MVYLKHYPLILGIPWFKAHEPEISWTQDLISFPNCNGSTSSITAPIPNDFSQSYYREYTDVFSDEAAKVLPIHTAYDHEIVLMPGTEPPFGPIYSLSELELETLS